MRRVMVVLAAGAAIAGCGGGGGRGASGPSTATTTTSTPAQRSSVTPVAVQRALLADHPDGVQAASCRPASASVRAHSPFGPNPGPLFTCEVTVRGRRGTYVVQVMGNGCFVAERTPPGRAIYACGVK